MSGLVTYLNLTSGLEAAPWFPGAKLVRIQSSHLESFALWSVIAHVDYGFLIDAATTGVVLVDGGSRRGPESRAQWQGVPWLRYAYERSNGLEPSPCRFASDFERVYSRSHALRDDGNNKLRYVRKLTGASTLRIDCASFVSTLDGKYEALSACLATR